MDCKIEIFEESTFFEGGNIRIIIDVTYGKKGIDLFKLEHKFSLTILKFVLAAKNDIKAKAAEFLRINRTTLVEKLKRYEVEGIT